MTSIDTLSTALNNIKVEIENDNSNLTVFLMKFPWVELNQQVFMELLTHLVNITVPFGSVNALKSIIHFLYTNGFGDTGQLDFLTDLFCQDAIASETLFFIAKSLSDDYQVEYYFDHLINYDSAPKTLIAAKNLENIFQPSEDTWIYLYDKAVSREISIGITNYLIKDFLMSKLPDALKPAQKPSWIIDHHDGLLTESQLLQKINLENNMEADFSLELREKFGPVNAIRYMRQYNIDLFRIYGPVNIQLTDDLTTGVCSKLGGCRMLKCTELEDIIINDEEVDDFDAHYQEYPRYWFTGSCDTCHKKIKKSHYAVRRPVVTGSFIGCYCSWDCVLLTIEPDEAIERILVDTFKKNLETYGIYERK